MGAAVPTVKTALEAIEALTVGNPCLLGDTVILADFYLIPIFVYLSMTPEFEVVTAETPKLKTWWDLVRELPKVKKICS
jgi:glutathione S-transferase